MPPPRSELTQFSRPIMRWLLYELTQFSWPIMRRPRSELTQFSRPTWPSFCDTTQLRHRRVILHRPHCVKCGHRKLSVFLLSGGQVICVDRQQTAMFYLVPEMRTKAEACVQSITRFQETSANFWCQIFDRVSLLFVTPVKFFNYAGIWSGRITTGSSCKQCVIVA